MKWHCFETKDLLFVDKPEGISTHGVEKGHIAFVESWEKERKEKLFVTHRLDKNTSGALVFARSAEAAERLRINFVEREVRKKYIFLTDRKSTDTEFRIETEIQKEGKAFVSRKSDTPNAKTTFKMLKRSPFFELWQAEPETGKSHQIRLHAKDLGLTILGDTTYGGTPFARMCLHSAELHIPGEKPWIVPPPRLFERLGLLKDPEVTEILTVLDRRERRFHFLGHREVCLRLYDREFKNYALEQLGEVLWLSWFEEKDPTQRDLERWDLMGRLLNRPVLIQKRLDRGEHKDSAPKWELGEIPETWQASESGVKYEFRKNQGESHGLFLDQRRNRLEFSKLVEGKKVLNLFSYTGGFSLLAAAKGLAEQTTSVDLSPAATKWAERNFVINDLDPKLHEFFAADCFFFLERAEKRGRKWDRIVLDPPIFSRHQKQVFRIEKDLPTLLKLAKNCLAPKGVLFFSTHYEAWNEEKLSVLLKKHFPTVKIQAGHVDLDFESERNQLKSFFLSF